MTLHLVVPGLQELLGRIALLLEAPVLCLQALLRLPRPPGQQVRVQEAGAAGPQGPGLLHVLLQPREDAVPPVHPRRRLREPLVLLPAAVRAVHGALGRCWEGLNGCTAFAFMSPYRAWFHKKKRVCRLFFPRAMLLSRVPTPS